MDFLIIFLNLILFIKFQNVNTQTNMTVYRNLPPLYDFDNYDHCLAETSSKYCMVFAEIVPNNSSNIWKNIEILSNDLTHHFRHENLFFGVCIEKCLEIMEKLSAEEIQNYASGKLLENEITTFYEKIHKRREDYDNRMLYHNDLDVCLNYRFQQMYNLSITTSIEYCVNSERAEKLDLLDITFCLILAAIILLNIICSLNDYRLKLRELTNSDNNDFYKNKIQDTGYKKLLTSFSICRNYYRITRAPSKNSNSLEADLNFTYAFRIFALFIVILGHCLMLLMSMQILNPEFFENYFYKAEIILFQNGSAFIQIFFVLAGFLFKLKFDERSVITPKSDFKMGFLVYVQCFLSRYLRIIPSVLLVILFNATFFIRLGDGPFWRHSAVAEYTFCREYWWKNLLMINNFMLKDSCAQHTWYLAADMQLFEQFLLTAILTARFQFLRKPLYIFIGLCAFLVPGLITYFYKLDAIHFLKPESYRYLYFKDVDTFYLTYPQFYCNIGGYLMGFICAEIYMKSKFLKKFNFKKYRNVIKYEILILAVIFTITMGLLYSGNLVKPGNDKNPIWLSLYASLYRNLWGLLGGFMILYMLMKMGWIVYEIACLPIFRLLGKISFQSYLWHVTVLRALEGFYRQPIYLNEFYMLSQIILSFILINCIAFVVTITVEYPISQVVNYILKRDISKTLSRGNTNEMKPHIEPIQI